MVEECQRSGLVAAQSKVICFLRTEMVFSKEYSARCTNESVHESGFSLPWHLHRGLEGGPSGSTTGIVVVSAATVVVQDGSGQHEGLGLDTVQE